MGKAPVIALLSLLVVFVSTFLLCILEPGCTFIQILFEVVSAFGTVGLSTGITPGLSDGSKLLSILVMYIGRLGPLTVASLWYFNRGERVHYAEGNMKRKLVACKEALELSVPKVYLADGRVQSPIANAEEGRATCLVR